MATRAVLPAAAALLTAAVLLALSGCASRRVQVNQLIVMPPPVAPSPLILTAPAMRGTDDGISTDGSSPDP